MGNIADMGTMSTVAERAVPPVQRLALPGSRGAEGARSSGAHQTTGLPRPLKSSVETLSGETMSDVRVHYNSPSPARLNALAYTQGSDIHVGPGQEQHLAHEAWHVVQQKQGRVRPNSYFGGHPLNTDGHLEREAHRMGDRALRHGPREPALAGRSPGGAPVRGRASSVIQLFTAWREPRDGMRVKLYTKTSNQIWKLELLDKDGKGRELCGILFQFSPGSSFSGPELSIDSMQARSGTSGSGTVLMKNIPWAVAQIITHNPRMTNRGKGLKVHSGFANIIAYQMTVKTYAEALGLRETPGWKKHWTDAVMARVNYETPVGDDAPLPTISESDEFEEDLSPSVNSYDLSKFPAMWADTQMLIESGLFDIDAGYIKFGNVDETFKNIAKAQDKQLFNGFHAKIDIKNLAELRDQTELVKKLQEEAARKLLESGDEL